MGLKEKLNFTIQHDSDIETISLNEDDKIAKKIAEVDEYNEKYPEPTAEEYAKLKKVIGHAPYLSYLICFVELAERASYYGVTGLLGNFIQLSLPKGGNGTGAAPKGTQENAGALGLGLQAASAITLLLSFLAYLAPLLGGYLADKKWGRLKTIWLGVYFGAVAHILLFIAGLPTVLKHGHSALAPTIIGILLLSLGTGFIKPNLLPLLYEQYPHKRDYVKTLKDGSKVIVSQIASYERMTLFFYWSINVGAFFSLATSYSAKDVGYWLAFLLPGIVYIFMIPVLLLLRPKLNKAKASGYSILEESFKVIFYLFKSGWISRYRKGTFWDYAKPSTIEQGNPEELKRTNKKGVKKISWTDQFADDVKVTIQSSQLFLFFPIYFINDGGIGSIQNSQSNAMTTNGVPNDLISNFNPITIIVFIPILNYIIYPIFRKLKINFRPVYRIFTGFILAALSSVAGAIIQWYVYRTSPCGYYASDCDIGDGVSPISVWVETVLYVLGAMSECLAVTAAYEIAYARAPEHMKGVVMALFLFTYSLAAAISEACTGALIDPYLIWPFVATAVVGVVAAFAFLWLYRDLHIVMENERLAKIERESQQLTEQLDHLNANNNDGKLFDEAAVKSIISYDAPNEAVTALEAAETFNIINK
ncbi:hypothetical protein WICMUC_000721 [Wickerhamomyces mucosus]|uniref:Peptide transporter PTR2 n=1 Tax=Wickerhamomyces mucosus TaxID=1378264 RepID=A0A9P8PYK6_9ASCO|nr:hypothetical protein WICMUC_000721 [Wickerhamomyces mucosus]